MNNSGYRVHILITGIFLLVIVIVIFLLFTKDNRTEQVHINSNATNEIFDATGQQAVTPIENNSQASETLLIKTKFGNPISVDNFLNSKDVQQYDDSTYLVKEEFGPNGLLYQIFFFKGGSIKISLLDSNIKFSRERAEAALNDLIDVSPLELCALNVSVTVPSSVSQELDSDYSGFDFGLSTCPSSVPLNEL